MKNAVMQARIDAMYVDKLDGKVAGDFFDRMAGQWRDEQSRCLRDIERHQEAEQSYMDEGLRILELARNAQALFERQPAHEKRRLLNFMLSNCTWEDWEVVATFRQPFDLLAETTSIAACAAAADQAKSAKNEIWLCRQFLAIRSRGFSLLTGKIQGIYLDFGLFDSLNPKFSHNFNSVRLISLKEKQGNF